MRQITRGELTEQFGKLKTDPEGYRVLCDEFIRQHPNDSHGYFSRHNAWDQLGRRDLALQDLNKSLELEKHPVTLCLRGILLGQLGRHDEAVKDFNHLETIDPEGFEESRAALFRAHSNARLGNATAALADCARLPDDHWTPNLFGAPGGTKQEITAKMRDIAEAARDTAG